MKAMFRTLWWVAVLSLILPGCSAQRKGAGKDAAEFKASLTALSVPLDLQDYRVVSGEGHRGIFLKLTRLPDSVEDHSEKNPPRIIVEIKGPTGAEAPEEEFPGLDTLVSRVRLARYFGVLQVTLDLQGEDVPPYSVHRMADWVMIRLEPKGRGILESLTPSG